MALVLRITTLFFMSATLVVSPALAESPSAEEHHSFIEMACTASWGNYPYQNHVGYGSTCSVACAQAMNYCYTSAGRYNAQYCRVGSCYATSR